MAFKFTYNNGGIEENGIGFLKTCSDAFIQQNIKAKIVWCANDGCLCRNYFDGEISRNERKESYIEELGFLISSGNTQWAGDIVRLTRKGFRYYGAVGAMLWSEKQKHMLLVMND